MSEHYSVDLEENDQGWWIGRCECGWGGSPYPTVEDACDALMEHAFAAGKLAAVVRAAASRTATGEDTA